MGFKEIRRSDEVWRGVDDDLDTPTHGEASHTLHQDVIGGIGKVDDSQVDRKI